MSDTNNHGTEPDAIEALLPWYVNGTLSPRDARRVAEALAQDPALAVQLAAIRDEAAETIHLNETLGVPSSRAMHTLFAAIDAEPARGRATQTLSARIIGFFAMVSPRALASAATAVVVVLVVQAGVIGTVLVKDRGDYQTAASQAPRPAAGMIALIRFAPDARIADINTLLSSYHASIVDGPKAGMFRVAIGDKTLSKAETAQLMARLQSEKIVGFVAEAE